MKYLKSYQLFESVKFTSKEELEDCLYDLTDAGIEVNIQQIKYFYFIEFKTKDIDLTETINKIGGMYDMRVFKVINGLICIPTKHFNDVKERTKEFLYPIFNNLKQEGDFFVSDGIRLFRQDLSRRDLMVNYVKIWEVLENKYHLSPWEIRGIIIDWMFEYFKLEDLTPRFVWGGPKGLRD